MRLATDEEIALVVRTTDTDRPDWSYVQYTGDRQWIVRIRSADNRWRGSLDEVFTAAADFIRGVSR